MSLVCTLCKNQTNFQCFVRLYKDTYEEVYKKKLFQDKTNSSYVHPICASFFPETELIILNLTKTSSLPDSGDNNLKAEPIVCNYKAVNTQIPNKCAICYCCTDGEVLFPCFFKNCCHRFHLQCIMNRIDVAKIKLKRLDDTTFKYGIVCPEHIPDFSEHQQSNSYMFFKQVEDAQLTEELQGYEDMFAKINAIIANDPQLEKIFEEPSIKQNNDDTAKKKSRKEKRQRKRVDSKTNEDSQEKSKPKESSAVKARQRSREKERKGLGIGALGGIKRGKNGLLNFRFRTKNRPDENKDNKEGDLNKSSQKKRDRSRKKSVDPNSIAQAGETTKSTKPESESVSHSHSHHKDGLEAAEALVMMRKKKAGDSLYNLRDEIKTTSRLKYDSFVNDFSAPKKTKEKTTTSGDANRLLSTEEKKKLFWNEINEIYFRKPYTDEAELLMFSESRDIATSIQAELNSATDITMSEETKAAFDPNFDVAELKVFTAPDYAPTTFNAVDSLKVMFEFNNNATDTTAKRPMSYLGYFRMKKKAQNEMPVPEDPKSIDTSDDPKYCAVSSTLPKELKDLIQDNLRPHTFKSKHKFNDQNVDYQDLSVEGYHKLFGLKHVESLTPEDAQTIKAKSMLSQDLGGMEEENGKIQSLNELSKEIIYFKYLLQHFVIMENNVRREKFTYGMREDFSLPKTNKLQEKTKKLESELKLGTTKKYFHGGFADRTNNTLTRTYFRDAPEQIVSKLTIIPKVVDDDEDDSKIIRIARQTKPAQVVETDCCICFYNQFTESNPIIYCSNCNTSFHKYCYGIPEIPTEDFYCDMCLSSNDPNMRKKSVSQKLRKSSFRPKITQTDKDIKCGLCSVEELPLKKFKKNDWFHVTCLLLHDMIQFKNGEWLLKPEKSSYLEQAKSENEKTECSICKTKIGIVDKCAGSDCNKHFHVMCAYLHGYEIDLIECDESKEDKTKNGLNTHIFCVDHLRNPNRNLLHQQYYRRYTTNYKNTLNYDTLDDYIKHLNEEEETSQITTQVEEFSASSKINEAINGNELNGAIIEKREAEVGADELENQFLEGLAKKTKVV